MEKYHIIKEILLLESNLEYGSVKMYIKKMHIKNFKSYVDQEISFERMSVIVGSNASGKSNIIDAFRFIKNIIEYGLVDAISLAGGTEYLLNSTIGREEPLYFSFETDMDAEMDENEKSVLTGFKYEFKLSMNRRGNGYTITEDRFIVCREIKYNIDETPHLGNIVTEYSRPGYGKIKEKIIQAPENLGDDIKEKYSLKFAIDYLNKNNEKKELLLTQMLFFIMPRFSFIRLIKIYDFDSKLLKKSSEIAQVSELTENGSNIALILKNILNNSKDKEQLINLVSDVLPFIEKLEVKTNYDKSLVYSIEEKYSRKSFKSHYMSDGTVNIIAIIIALYFETHFGILILEEPERNVHPKLMSKIVEMAQETSKKRQVIITTHTPEMVKCSDIKSLYFVQRDKGGYSRISKPSDSKSVNIFLENEINIEELFLQDMLGEFI